MCCYLNQLIYIYCVFNFWRFLSFLYKRTISSHISIGMGFMIGLLFCVISASSRYQLLDGIIVETPTNCCKASHII